MTRKFEANKAKRERVPMLVGLFGPSGSGKTYSALRIATGMKRVTGGEIFFVDTEARRGLHYADLFDFTHVPFDAPFSSRDYLDVIRYCKGQGATTIIVDSSSHEHDGPGGLLEQHEAYLDEKAGSDWKKRQKLAMSAWIKPKAERRRLIDEILRMGVNGIFCFRAKEKVKLVAGKDPIQMGWMPIAGSEFTFEMTANVLLYPGAGGVPNWAPDESGEKVMLKKPVQLADVFKDGQPLSESTGEGLAKWAQGDEPASEESDVLSDALETLKNATTIEDLDIAMNDLGGLEWTDNEKKKLRATVITRRGELK